MLHCFYITVEDVDVCEPVRKKPRLDTDRDSAMGFSVFTGGKSTTLSEVSFLNDQLHITHLLELLLIGSSGQGTGGVGF